MHDHDFHLTLYLCVLPVFKDQGRGKLVCGVKIPIRMVLAKRAGIEPEEARMRKLLSVVLLWMAVLPALCQSPSAKYQPGTITEVKEHQDKAATGSAATGSSVKRFDISVKVGSTVYVVLYTPPPGTYGGQYSQGMNLLVLVGEKTITFNDVAGRSIEVPIVSRTAAASPDNH
jgi:hypothetical protein